tara:strand:- start:8906 stop:9574 length:669 start_codon:yes stop_codon:yes gene_type:complete
MINEIYYKIFRNTAFWDPAKGETVQKYINIDRFSNVDFRAVENIENHFEFKNKQVLDLGAGVGNYSVEFLKKGSYVDWLDVSTRFMETIKEYVNNDKELKKHRISFINKNINEISKINKKYDLIFIRLSWRYCFSEKKFSQNIDKCLKDGGILYIREEYLKNKDQSSSLKKSIQNYFYLKFNYKIGHPCPKKNHIGEIFKTLSYNLLHYEIIDNSEEYIFKK